LSASEIVILLVDDEPSILSALRRSLRREGWEIQTASSGEEGLALLAERAVSLVVSDQKMPGMGGLEFLRRVGEHAPSAHRVLLTGWPEMLSQAELKAAGIDAVIPKPWEDGELKSTLRGLVAGD
jgi:CheY-like chemotaxis protein